jgi:hypothetical protein
MFFVRHWAARVADVESRWNVMAHGDAREGKWMGNCRLEGVANTLHGTSEHGVSSITTADAHTSAANSWLNWRPCRFKWTRPFHRKTNSGFCASAITFQRASTLLYQKLYNLANKEGSSHVAGVFIKDIQNDYGHSECQGAKNAYANCTYSVRTAHCITCYRAYWKAYWTETCAMLSIGCLIKLYICWVYECVLYIFFNFNTYTVHLILLFIITNKCTINVMQVYITAVYN